MLISVDRDESRAAVVEDGQLVHLEIEPVSRLTCKGNIYRAMVARVEPSLQSAFVDFGNDKQGFLPVGEIHPKLRGKNDDKKAAIQDLIRAKQEILVQVVRDEIGQKGATLSTFISLPGRYLVLIPESDKDKAGVSRKLSDEARDRIKKLTETMKVPEGFGLIVRTAGETATETELAKDLLYLTRQWEHITKKYDESKGPTLLYAERSLAVRFVRDYFAKDIEELVIDDDETLHEVQEFLHVLMPRSLAATHRYSGDVPMFARYGIEGKVEDVFSRQVFLAGGGSIVIDQTEALVSIDVNSGRVKEKDIEETARATNIEAAQEIARQLMLRDMGGLVVIDFIDMHEKKHVREVEQALKDAFKHDKARTKLGHISEFGLLELSRQRIKSSVNKGAFDTCPHCSGTGRMRSFESVAMSVLRRIYETVAQRRVRYVVAVVPAPTARYLLNARRTELAGIERQYHLTVEVIGVENMPSTLVQIEYLEEPPAETGTERVDRIKMQRVNQDLDLVRNVLVRREETRLQLDAVLAKRGPKVDYAAIYKEVLEMAPKEGDFAKAPRKERDHGGRSAGRKDETVVPTVEPVTTPAVVDVDLEPAPQRGFGAWIKRLFGFGEQPVAGRPDQVEEPAPAPALAAPVAAPAAERQPAVAQDRPRYERNDRPERGDRPDRPERPDRGERPDRSERGERADRPERGERPERGDRPDRGDRRDRRRDNQGEPRVAEAKGPGEGRIAEAKPAAENRNGEARLADTRPTDAKPAEVKVVEVKGAEVKAPEAKGGEPRAARPEGAPAEGTEAADKEVVRRRRRRRRRGGAAGDRGDTALAAGQEGSEGEGDDEGDEGGDGSADASAEGADATPANGQELVAAAAPAVESAGETASAAADAGPEAVHDSKGDAEAVLAPEEPAESAAAPETAEPAPAVEAVAPEQVIAAPAVDEPVDVRSLMNDEIAKVMAEGEPAVVAAEIPVVPAAAVDALPPQRPAAKRFVIDLRTPK